MLTSAAVAGSVVFDGPGMIALAQQVTSSIHVVARRDGSLGLAGPEWSPGVGAENLAVVARLPAMYPEWLGDRAFLADHGVRFPYIAGEMAHGIAGTELVSAMARDEMLGFLGAGGLSLDTLDGCLHVLGRDLAGRRNWGVNLIHRPDEPELERAVTERLLEARVPQVSVSAFMEVTPTVVRCVARGLRRDAAGSVVRARSVLAKVSRPEVAEQFMSPPPKDVLAWLVEQGELTDEEARLAGEVAVAEDVTVEADSGGHTDGRPLVALLPAVLALRNRLIGRGRTAATVRVGVAGGIGDPGGVAAAFAAGAAYVVTGSVNQMSVEAAVSARAKEMLGAAGIADVAMAPAGDMFEVGAEVQVLRRGTMFASRAQRLRRLFDDYRSLEEMPVSVRARLEAEVFGLPLEEVWDRTRSYWMQRSPAEIELTASDPRRRMALMFRWYLGSSIGWAVDGDPGRVTDYQVWCSPAVGVFNAWAERSFLSVPEQRSVTQIARNLLQGAAVLTRVHQLRSFGVPVPAGASEFRPRPLV